MLKVPVQQSLCSQTLFPWHMPSVSGEASASFPALQKPVSIKKHKTFRVRYIPSKIKASSTETTKRVKEESSTLSTKQLKGTAARSSESPTRVKAVVSIQQLTILGDLQSWVQNPGAVLDAVSDRLSCKALLLELLARELDDETGKPKKPIEGYASWIGEDKDDVRYQCEFVVPQDFGKLGAVRITNRHRTEMYVKNIAFEGLYEDISNVTCNSWVQSQSETDPRIFFVSKSYLPSETPSGLKDLRDRELVLLRGDGTGERKSTDRIYDYDVYNDLGIPDEGLARPILGGKEHPYPRRCRTGRPPTETDKLSESREGTFYVPRDEEFSELKNLAFTANTISSVLGTVIPGLQTSDEVDSELRFPYFTAIDALYNENIALGTTESSTDDNLLSRICQAVNFTRSRLRFKPPEFLDRDKFAWFRDVEFGRQTLAGINPYSIQLVKEWPLKSKLDPKEYGPPESAITDEIVNPEIRAWMTVEEAFEQKKLFMLDYHDLLLPYVNKVRELKGTTLYGSRTLFFLTPSGTLKPVAIELTRPPGNGKPQWKRVFKSSWDATGSWIWRLAKCHVLAHDSGIHQLVSHWLRTHCCTEPYIIATHRQLSVMHPIYRLVHRHFRYNMKINAAARQSLINAYNGKGIADGGIIELGFSPGKYSLELSSVAYDQLWRFDQEALPADLIARGLAEEDPTAPHGLKLLIEDYPFANDGLILWDAIKEWVTEYVNHYYPEASVVTSDEELNAWWTEIRTVGHGDKKDEPWWPSLKTPEDLIGILTIMIWVASGHHAAVNFGQYDFAGYMPNRPTIARTNMPTEDLSDEEWKKFEERPEDTLLSSYPSRVQAATVVAILNVLSSHSPEEEYIGKDIEPKWAEVDPKINAAFEVFSGKLLELQGTIDARNADESLRNRTGAGVVPYELLKPYSKPGVTGQGVPNSISI